MKRGISKLATQLAMKVLAYAADAVRHGAAIFEETEAAALVAVGRA